MKTAHVMVWQLGMGDSGYVGDYTKIPHEQLSDEIKLKLNNDTGKIIEECLGVITDLFKTERAILDRFAKELLTREELEFDEIEAIFKEYNKTIRVLKLM